MSDKNTELEIINHLLEVEKNAAILIDEAKKEADAKKNEALSIFNTEYKNKFDTAMNEKKTSYEAKLQTIKESHDSEMEAFKKQMESKSINKESFEQLLDKLLLQS